MGLSSALKENWFARGTLSAAPGGVVVVADTENKRVRLIEQACVACPPGKYEQGGVCLGCPPGRYRNKAFGSGGRAAVDSCLICPKYSSSAFEEHGASACVCHWDGDLTPEHPIIHTRVF